MYSHLAQRRWGAFALLLVFCGAFGHAAVPHAAALHTDVVTIASDCSHSHGHRDALSHSDDCTLCQAFTGLTLAAPVAVGTAQLDTVCFAQPLGHRTTPFYAVAPIRGPPRA